MNDIARTARSTGAQHLLTWLEHDLGGRVTRLERLKRWRASWNVDIERDGRTIPLYARGARVSGFLAPFPLAHELNVHALLEHHGIPVPHVHGLVDDDRMPILVMDRVPGVQGLALAADDERSSLLMECIDRLADIHAIPLDDVARHGIEVPTDASGFVMSRVYRDVEQAYVDRVSRRDPVVEFLRSWVRRHQPTTPMRAAFVTWDAAQFLHDGGRLTALIDFELAHVGDAYMDLATLRTRDSIEPFGDLGPAFERYAARTGGAIDFDVLRFYEVAQLTVSMMLQAPVLHSIDLDADYVTHLTWYVESGRYACDVLGELLRHEQEPIEVGSPVGTRHTPAFAQLVASLRAGAASEPIDSLVRYGVASATSTTEDAAGDVPDFAGWRRRCDYRLARHLERACELGPQVEAADVAETAALLGRPFPDLAHADEALSQAIEAGSVDDLALLRVAERRLRRFHTLLGPAGSLIVRHPPLQVLPDQRVGA